MRNIEIEESKSEFSATILYKYGTRPVSNKVNYDMDSLKWFIVEEVDEERASGSGVNDIEEWLRGIQSNLSYLYIRILEFIAEGKLKPIDILPHDDNLRGIKNELEFLDRMSRAFQEMKVTCKSEELKQLATSEK